MRRGIIATTLGLVALIVGWEAQAEVRVVTGRNGEYRETRILLPELADGSLPGSSVWIPYGRTAKSETLNPKGAARGDLWPTIGEPGRSPFAWAVWSRLNELDYDLAWSRWTDHGWQKAAWLNGGNPQPGHDLDPDMAFDEDGRPFIVWWRDNGQWGRVYLSVYLLSRWMIPYPVSNTEIDARYPTLELLSSGAIKVTYETPEGTVAQIVVFNQPVTITDDIDPLDHMVADRAYYVEETNP